MITNTRKKIPRGNLLETIGCFFIAISASFLQMAYSSIYIGRNIAELPFFIGVVCVCVACKPIKCMVFNVIHSVRFLFVFGCLMLFSVLGCITGSQVQPGNTFAVVISVYSDFRSIFVFSFLWLCASASSFPVLEVDRVVTKIFFFLSALEVLATWKMGGGGVYLDEMEYSRMSILVIPAMFLVLRYLAAGKIILAYLCLLATVYMSAVALMRLNYLFVAIGCTALIAFSIKYLKTAKTALKSFLLLAGLAVGAVILPVKIISYLEENPIRQIHGLNRLDSLFKGDDREDVRQANIKIFFSEPEEFVIPQGLGTKTQTPAIMSKFRQRYGVMSSADSNIFYCCYHFGIFLGVILFSYIAVSVIKSVASSLRSGVLRTSTIFCVGFSIAFFAMFLLKSWIFIFFASALQFGLLCFWILRAPTFNSFYDAIYEKK